eukprot:CAMPEP_0113940040 /NCGR_PEP_ID=MMETSP1339-20121228/6233_1 /TAXON_ID=94617 /ORGANISM="Fibrocapsa japonica" /LENGTH=177 /DNA_ID=CAMNT_0000943717 /DNA_START=8 /DNA_END=538 /DNA_ORIENTATION=+ /assembly_acc=CAM_ASM_000762
MPLLTLCNKRPQNSGLNKLFQMNNLDDTPPVFSFGSYDEFFQVTQSMEGDPLDGGGSVVVFRGNPRGRVMVVGEAPGEEEDKQKLPFVGKAGQLLEKMLTEAGFDTGPQGEVYITNLVKRRPPNNRNPTPEEVSFYLPLLQEEIRLVDPDIIVCAGSFSMKALLEEDRGITKVRGTW